MWILDAPLVYTMFSEDTIDTKIFVVHHIDKNIYNNRFDNLQKMTKSDHQSLHNSGDKNPMFGKKLSQETRRKMTEGHTGKHSSDETRRKMSESSKGKTRSEEHYKRLSESHKGKKHSEEHCKRLSESHKGKKHSHETKEKMRQAHLKKGKES